MLELSLDTEGMNPEEFFEWAKNMKAVIFNERKVSGLKYVIEADSRFVVTILQRPVQPLREMSKEEYRETQKKNGLNTSSQKRKLKCGSMLIKRNANQG